MCDAPKPCVNHTDREHDRVTGDRFTRARARLMLAFVALAVVVSSAAVSPATSYPYKFVDGFNTLGPLASSPSDVYEVVRGAWEVVDLQDLLTPTPRRVLMQSSLAATPKEPVVFIRDRVFRTMSVQVTGALLEERFASSLGIVFRAPVLEDGTADPDNLYLFSAQYVGPSVSETGRTFMLWKRVTQGYFPLTTKIAPTWMDLTQPHQYKVTMEKGHIQAFVDGRLVIEHTDVPSGDVPTQTDPLPGLPFDAGSVGLRTSNGAAWFDDLIVVSDDAHEGRANVVDVFAEYGIGGQTKRGIGLQTSNELMQRGLPGADTGFVYETGDHDTAVVRPFEGSGFSLGASLRTSAAGDLVTSTSRIMRMAAEVTDPSGMVTVRIDAAKIDTTVTANCKRTTSDVSLARTELTISLGGEGAPDTTIGPFPIASSYGPNTVLFERAGLVRIIAHATRASTLPPRVEATALRIEFPGGQARTDDVIVGGARILPGQNLGSNPALRIDIGNAVAGRYCSPKIEA